MTDEEILRLARALEEQRASEDDLARCRGANAHDSGRILFQRGIIRSHKATRAREETEGEVRERRLRDEDAARRHEDDEPSQTDDDDTSAFKPA